MQPFLLHSKLSSGAQQVILLILAYGLFVLLRGLFSPFPAESIIYASGIFLFLILIIFFFDIFSNHPDKNRFLSQLALLYAVFNNGTAFFQLLVQHYISQSITAPIDSISGIHFSSDSFSFGLIFSLPILLASNLFLSGFQKKLSAALLILQLVFLLMKAHPAAISALIISFILGFLWFLIRLFKFELSTDSFRKMIRRSVFILLFFPLFIFVVQISPSADKWAEQTSWLTDYHFGSELEKTGLWDQSLRMYQDHRLFGIGEGNWKIVFPSGGLNQLKENNLEQPLIGPYNHFLKIMVENGVVGLILFLLPLILLLIRSGATSGDSLKPEEKMMGLALLTSFFGLIILLMVHHPLSALSIPLAISIAYLFSIQTRQKAHYSGYFLKPLRIGIYVAIPILILLQSIDLFAEISRKPVGLSKLDESGYPYRAEEARIYWESNRPEEAETLYRKAIAESPWQYPLLTEYAYFLLEQEKPEEALNHFAKSRSILSQNDYNSLGMSQSLALTGNPDSAYAVICLIQDADNLPNYKAVLSSQIRSRIAVLQSRIDEEILINTLNRISEDETWLLLSFEHAQSEKRHFDNQVILEALYALEVLDKSISPELSQELTKKYFRVN